MVGPTKLVKSDGEVAFTVKAFNGRCVSEWLAHCAEKAYIDGLARVDSRIPFTYVAMIFAGTSAHV